MPLSPIDPAQLQQDLKAAALPLEEKRLTTLKVVVGAYLVYGLFLAFLYMQTEEVEFLLYGGAAAVALYPVLAGNFISTFKKQVIRGAVASLGGSLEYRHKGHIGQGSFVASQLYPGAITAFRGEDVIWGAIGEAEFGFSELRIHQRGLLGSSGETFTGLFLEIKRPAMPKGRVLVLARGADALTKPSPDRGEAVAFPEDPAFEAAFCVLARREAAARAVLSPAMRQRLLSLLETAGGPMHVAFGKEKIYVAIPRAEDLFEPKLYSPLTDPEVLSKLSESLIMPATIATTLGMSLEGPTGRAPRPRRERETPPAAEAPPAPPTGLDPRERRVVLSMLTLYGVGLVVLFAGFGGLKQVVANQLLGGYKQQTEAVVVNRRQGDTTYPRVDYRFTAAGKSYTGTGTTHRESVLAGQTIKVKYAAPDPSFSVTPEDEAYDIGLTLWTFMSVAGFLGLGVAPTLGIIFRKRLADASFLS